MLSGIDYKMDYITPIGKNLQTITNYLPNWNRDQYDSNLLANREILKIAGILNSNHIDSGVVDLPKLVVVGTQSSGKSSLLNSLIGLDILPIGKSMTTRTPLHLDLIQSNASDTNRVEFGYFNELQWFCQKKISINYPELTPEQTEQIYKEINVQTVQKAGNELNISANPIYMKIYAKGIPNLSLVDLPGLTSVAMTDRGQPKDIKEQIIRVVKQYIEGKNTLILAVMAARPDIEADMAMEIVKGADPKGERTIGILTKLDLMNEDADISAYLENRLSADLKLKYGYFGIRNRSNPQQTIAEAIVAERTFFQNHRVYSDEKYKTRLSIPVVSGQLSSILIYNIRLCLPNVLDNINKKLEETNAELGELGSSIPADKEVRLTILNGLLTEYVRTFVGAIDLRGSNHPTGRLIKEEFVGYRGQIGQMNPFDNIGDDYFVDLLKSYDGIHMSFPYLPIEVLEKALQDKKTRPIYQLEEPSVACLNKTRDMLVALNNGILDAPPLKKYPNLIKTIKNIVINELLMPKYTTTVARIHEIIGGEESYIWTDQAPFIEAMNTEFSKIIGADGSFDIEKFKAILFEYYKTVIANMRDTIPKAIVYHLIRASVADLNNILFEKVLQGDTAALLDEFPEIEDRRKVLEKNRDELMKVKKMIETIL